MSKKKKINNDKDKINLNKNTFKPSLIVINELETIESFNFLENKNTNINNKEDYYCKEIDTFDYLNIIEKTQLVSIDLIIYNNNNKVLLGKRKNNPAKDTLFLPGSRLFKYEKFKEGINRILNNEIGINITDCHDLKFRGVYSHPYNNNFDNNLFGTHYISFNYSIKLNNNISIDDDIFYLQHLNKLWLNENEILENPAVHIYTKNFFINNPDNAIFQTNLY